MFKIDDEVKIIGGHLSSGVKWDGVVGEFGIITHPAKHIGSERSFDWWAQLKDGSEFLFSENELELVDQIKVNEAKSGECVAVEDINRIKQPDKQIRTFGTGATRDTDLNKLDYEGFFSPLVLERYAQYLNKHRVQSDGQLRDSDNWQKGIPKETYIKSKFRHFIATWLLHRGHAAKDEKGNHVTLEESLCGDIFNTMGYLHELLKEKESMKPKELVDRKSLYCKSCQKLVENAKIWEVVPLCERCSEI